MKCVQLGIDGMKCIQMENVLIYENLICSIYFDGNTDPSIFGLKKELDVLDLDVCVSVNMWFRRISRFGASLHLTFEMACSISLCFRLFS